MSTSDDLPELEALMAAARNRVLYILIPLLVVLIIISSQVPWSGIFDPRRVLSIIYWSLGDAVILGLLVLWYRVRVAATRRLVDLLQTGAFHMHRIEKTRIMLWRVVPVGYEIDVDLVSGEHFAFGFWTEYEAERLIALLTRSQVNDGSAGADVAVDNDDD